MVSQMKKQKNSVSIVTLAIEVETNDPELEKRLLLLAEDFELDTLDYLLKFSEAVKISTKVKKK
jgi:hypothetical protein